MAWEKRKQVGGNLYYTRTVRVNGRRVRQYVGGGEAGQLAAALDAQRRAEYQARSLARRQERDLLEQGLAPLGTLCQGNHVLVRAALLAAGYHRHRGEWRSPKHEPDEDQQQQPGR